MSLVEQELTLTPAQRKAITDRARNEAWVDDNYPTEMPDGWQPDRFTPIMPTRAEWLEGLLT